MRDGELIAAADEKYPGYARMCAGGRRPRRFGPRTVARYRTYAPPEVNDRRHA